MATSVDETAVPSPADIAVELARLAASHPPPEQFFQRFLGLAVERLGARGGEAWGLSRQGLLAKICSVGGGDVPPDDAAAARRRLQRLLQTLHSGQGSVQLLSPGRGGAHPADQPSLLAPLMHHRDCVGVVEIHLSAGATAESAQAQLETLRELVGHASRYVAGLRAGEPTAEQFEFLRRLEQIALQLHGRTSAREVARTAANEGRLLLRCDRVGVAVRRGKHAEIAAISGLERIVQRSNLVRAMSRVASQALASGRAIRYTGSLEGFPREVEAPLVDYLAESGALSLWCIPLAEPGQPPDNDSRPPTPRREAIGVLLVEHLSDGGRSAEGGAAVSDREVEQLAAHVAQALSSAREREQVFLLPLRRTIGSCLAWATGDGQSKCLLAAAIAAALLAIFALVPMPYRVEAQGRLLPAIQRRVFAPQDGEVVEVYIRDGERVAAGQPLLRLRNDELAIGILKARNELGEKQQLQAALEAQENEARRSAPPAEQIRLRGRIAQSAIEIEGLRQHLAALAAEQARLVVKSDIAGVIATFQPQELLAGRPVQRGQLLVEVMDPAGPWQLELEFPAHRLNRILDAQQAREAEELPVEFVLATAPEQTCYGRMRRLATRATVGEAGSSAIPLVAAVDGSSIARPTVGAEVIARIDCGRTSLAYALFGDLIEFVRLHVW